MNGVYCCVIHECIVDILCTVNTHLVNNETNLYMKKCFLQPYTTSPGASPESCRIEKTY